MSDPIIEALLDKRAELAAQAKDIQSAMFHIDATLVVLGHRTPTRGANRFGKGELIALLGEAERGGCKTAREIAEYAMRAKGWDLNDRVLVGKLVFSVKDCRKRMNARA